jgi:hypothetical protein
VFYVPYVVQKKVYERTFRQFKIQQNKIKVLELIETYPELEDVLIEYAPAFKNLKNQVFRRTVAKIAKLQQAAAIGGVKTEELINRLRKEVGQDTITSKSGFHTISKNPVGLLKTKLLNGLMNQKCLQPENTP